MRRHRAGELGEHGEEQHRHRRRQPEQSLAHYSHYVERDGRYTSGGDMRDIHVSGDFLLMRVHLVCFAGLQPAFAGQPGISLAHVVQHSG